MTVGVVVSKSYTLTTDDDKALKRAIQADGLAMALVELDERMRLMVKNGPALEAREAELWRDGLREACYDNGVLLDDLFE